MNMNLINSVRTDEQLLEQTLKRAFSKKLEKSDKCEELLRKLREAERT